MTEFKILEEPVVTNEGDDWRHEIQLCRVPDWDDMVVIRPCYSTKQKTKDGKDFWNIAIRPLAFGMDEADKVICAIAKLWGIYNKKYKK